MPDPPASGGAVGSGSKGAIPKELPRRRGEEDPLPRVEEETLSRLREMLLPNKKGDTWEQSQFWWKRADHESAEGPLTGPGPRVLRHSAEKAEASASRAISIP